MKTSVGRTVLELAAGDITQLEVDAIACAAGSELRMGDGVAGAIKRAGGEGIEKEALLLAPIEPGQAVATTGHALKARWVVHTVVIGPDLRTSASLIAQATYNALACAEHSRARSIAMPAFGTGLAGLPLYLCASIMTAETVRYLKDHPHTGLRHVMFSTYTDPARAAFANALAGSTRF